MSLPPMPPRPERPATQPVTGESGSASVTPEVPQPEPYVTPPQFSSSETGSGNAPTNNSAYASDAGYAAYSSPPANTFGGQPPAPREPRSSKKPLIIGGAIGAGVLVLAGGAWAYSALAPASGGPEEAMPASAVLFAKIDLDPSADQKLAFLELQDKFPELAEQSDGDEESFRQIASSAFFSELDYTTEVEPWIGDRFAVGAIEGEDPNTPHMIAVYSINDAGEAKDAASKITDPSFVYEDKYLVLSDTEESLDAWKESIESEGTLADSKDYRDDMSKLDGDTIASMWIDMEKASALSESAADSTGISEMGLLQENITGSVVGGIHLEKDAIQAQFIAVGAGDVTADLELNNGNVSEVKNLPDNVLGAFAVANLDQTLTSLWTEYSSEIDDSTLDQISALGISLPDDFTNLVGTETAVGISSVSGSDGVPEISARMKGADESLLNRLAEDSGAIDMVDISKDGDAVLLSTGGSSDGKLGDSEKFKNSVTNSDKALVVAFIDIDGVLAEEGGESTGKTYGYAGASVSYDQKDDIADMTIRWVFND